MSEILRYSYPIAYIKILDRLHLKATNSGNLISRSWLAKFITLFYLHWNCHQLKYGSMATGAESPHKGNSYALPGWGELGKLAITPLPSSHFSQTGRDRSRAAPKHPGKSHQGVLWRAIRKGKKQRKNLIKTLSHTWHWSHPMISNKAMGGVGITEPALVTLYSKSPQYQIFNLGDFSVPSSH